MSRSVWGCGVSNTGYLPTTWGYEAAAWGRDEVGQVKVFEVSERVTSFEQNARSYLAGLAGYPAEDGPTTMADGEGGFTALKSTYFSQRPADCLPKPLPVTFLQWNW